MSSQGRIARFGLVGVASNGVYLGVLYGVGYFGPPVELAGAAAYLVSMAVNYLLQRTFAFQSQRQHRHAIWRFVSVHMIGLALNSAVLSVGTRVFGVHLLVAQAVAILLVAAWTYFALGRVVFPQSRSKVTPASNAEA